MEYAEQHKTIRLRFEHLVRLNSFFSKVQHGLAAAARDDQLALPVPSAVAAHGLQALIDGLIQTWLLDPQAFELVRAGQSTMDVYFTGLGFVIKPSSTG